MAATLAPMGDMYATATDLLTTAIGRIQGKSSGTLANLEGLTVDQRLEVAKIAALISISEELSGVHHGGINPEYDSMT